MSNNYLTVNATLTPTAQAVKVHGEGGLRLSLDIPQSDQAKFLAALPQLQGVAFTLAFIKGEVSE